MKRTIRLTESDLRRIVKESVERILNEENIEEGWFGNDERYGEKWWKPSTWKNDAQKKQIRQKRQQDSADAFKAELDKNMEKLHSKIDSKISGSTQPYRSRSSQGGYGSGWGSGYRQNDRTDQAGHIRAFDDELASYDAGLR